MLFYLVGVSSGLSTQDSTLKEEAGESDKEDDIETLLDDPAELENSSFVRRRETKKYIKAEEEENEMNETESDVIVNICDYWNDTTKTLSKDEIDRIRKKHTKKSVLNPLDKRLCIFDVLEIGRSKHTHTH